MSNVLKMDRDDAGRELEFELDYQLSLTTEERFELMFRKSREMVEVLLRNGHRNPVKIITRS